MPSVLQAVAEHASSTSFLDAKGERLSAGYDTSALGAEVLKGLVQMKTAADLLNLSKAQAPHLRKDVLVTNLRALEASNVLKYLEDNSDFYDQESGAAALPTLGKKKKNKPYWGQFASGPGFGVADPKGRSFRPKKPKGLGDLPGAGMIASDTTKPVDLWAGDIKEALESVVEFSHRAKYESSHLEKFIVDSSQKTNLALRLAAQDLNYPGLPGEAFVQPRPPRPQAGGRPPDVAPAWLDFLYAGESQGTDPFHGLEEHNIFGSPPVVPSEVKMQEAGDAGEEGVAGALGGAMGF